MPGQEDSLFSLELVVEKLYVPHVTCRFPAIAFRLLDFPTILISHVEDDLSKTIKAKIARDPYYQLPEQFIELKDKHGNFMVKKGKSCLFKISVETLKMHLTNTPLYVMIIDAFPEAPKLLGNSTIPLNSLMDDICVDIAKLGTTVPSVHGDKGLFKIYNLMGKEIGYFVLGFRLLCLGPGLIPHLPESVLTKRVVKRKGDHVVQVALDKSGVQQVDIDGSEQDVPRLNDTREMGSMTDVEKQDAILQTMEFDNKAVHVAISCPDEKPQLVTCTTQTEKRKKAKQDLNEHQRFIEHTEDRDDDDGIIINNIVCPPPMFYNSQRDPKIKMQKYLHHDQTSSFISDDLEIEDLENEESQETVPDDDRKIKKMDSMRQCESRPRMSTVHRHPSKVTKTGDNRRPDVQGGDVFPILTALISELTGIQNSHLLAAVNKLSVGRKPAVSSTQQKPPPPPPRSPPPGRSTVASKRLEELSQPRQPFRKTDPKTDEVSQSRVAAERPTTERLTAGRTYRRCVQPPTSVPNNKGWLRQTTDQPVKKSQLMFGLTHTQRLRLAKTNPGWLREMEKEEAEVKKKKEQQPAIQARVDSEAYLNVTNLSDTLTEVRRLAQRELVKYDTLNSSRDISTLESDCSGSKQAGPSMGKKWLSRYGKRSPSPKRRHLSPRHRSISPRKFKGGVQRIRDIRGNVHRTLSREGDEASQRSDQGSTRSIEVHLPSADIDTNDDDMSDTTINDMDAIPEDRHLGREQFPGFGKANRSFPESIDGQVNESLSETKDSDHPLESTRLSVNVSKVKESSDFDTRQFQSTDEPELQGLMSDEENRSDVIDSGRHGRLGAVVSASINSSIHKFPVLNPVASEQSPVPATRRSTLHLDILPSQGHTPPSQGHTPPPDTPRSQSQGSSRRPTPRPRKPTKMSRDSVHTDSISSYQPSDMDAVVSLSSDANYSDDFHPVGSEFEDSLTDISMSPDSMYPKLIPSTKLGYTT